MRDAGPVSDTPRGVARRRAEESLGRELRRMSVLHRRAALERRRRRRRHIVLRPLSD